MTQKILKPLSTIVKPARGIIEQRSKKNPARPERTASDHATDFFGPSRTQYSTAQHDTHPNVPVMALGKETGHRTMQSGGPVPNDLGALRSGARPMLQAVHRAVDLGSVR